MQPFFLFFRLFDRCGRFSLFRLWDALEALTLHFDVTTISLFKHFGVSADRLVS